MEKLGEEVYEVMLAAGYTASLPFERLSPQSTIGSSIVLTRITELQAGSLNDSQLRNI